jgi:hypothetical protein
VTLVVLLVLLVLQANLEAQAARLVPLGYRVTQVNQDFLEQMEPPVPQAQKALLEQQARRDQMVTMVTMEPLEQQVLRVHLEVQVVQLVPQVRQVQPVYRDHRVVQQEQLVQQVSQAFQEVLVVQAEQEHQAG